MADEKPDQDDEKYEAAPIAEPEDVDEAARLRRIDALENIEARREILLGQITVARGQMYEARDAGDEALAASLKAKVDQLNAERSGL